MVVATQGALKWGGKWDAREGSRRGGGLVANVDREQSSRRVTALKNGGRLIG